MKGIPRRFPAISTLCILGAGSWTSGVVIAAVVAASPAQNLDSAALGREWLDAVRAHRPGSTDEAATRIAGWSPAELEAAMKYFGDLDAAEINRVAVRAATLHADVAMWQWDAQQGIVRPPPLSSARAGGTPVVIVIDGSYVGTGNIGVHWSFARRVIDRMRPGPAGDELVRRWYRATIAYLLGNNSFTEGLPHVQRALRLFPADAFFAFASGCASETLASSRIQQVARSLPGGRASQVDVSSSGAHLRAAEAAFRRAIELDPALDAARLRLGRVLALRGDSRSSVPHLEDVLSRSTDNTIRYHAYLFLGERREAMRQFAAAREAYEHAARVFHAAQSPLLALSHLARRTGDRAAARRAATKLAELPAASRERDDPWWRYDIGLGEQLEAFQAELHAALERSPR